jgi:beta-N-acetylhexosaminidase
MKTAIGNHFIIGFESAEMTPALKALLTRVDPAGVVLFKRNIISAEQTWDLLRECQGCVSAPLLTCVDMEGGTVDRLRDVFGNSPSAVDVFATGDRRLFRLHGKTIGAICRSVGFNVDFAPTLDLAFAPALPVMTSRVVSTDPRKTVAYARAFLQGLADSGVLGCGKHFPGLGEVPLDTHKDLPVVGKSLSRLLAEDIEPYRLMRRDLPFIMVCHAIYSAAGKDGLPASLSAKWMTEILRKKLGYSGLIVTDDMEMGALQTAAPMEQASVQSLKAGADLLLICRQEDQVVRAYESVAKEAEHDRRFSARLQESSNRIIRFKKRFAKGLDLRRLPRPTSAKVEKLSRQVWELEERVRLQNAASENAG